MTNTVKLAFRVFLSALVCSTACSLVADDAAALRKACIDGNGPGWRPLNLHDFVNVNCDPDTWSMRDGMIHCKGTPVGVARLNKTVRNFEMVLEWRHLKSAGNSGVFVWVPPVALEKLDDLRRLPERHRSAGARSRLCREVRETRGQESRLVHDQRRCFSGRHVEHEAVSARFAQRAPKFPAEEPEQRGRPMEPLLHSRYQRRSAVVGQRRRSLRRIGCHPAEGYLCLESEGSPIDFKICGSANCPDRSFASATIWAWAESRSRSRRTFHRPTCRRSCTGFSASSRFPGRGLRQMRRRSWVTAAKYTGFRRHAFAASS